MSIAILGKRLLKALALSDGLVFVSLLTMIAMEKVWSELFKDIFFFISFHIFISI